MTCAPLHCQQVGQKPHTSPRWQFTEATCQGSRAVSQPKALAGRGHGREKWVGPRLSAKLHTDRSKSAPVTMTEGQPGCQAWWTQGQTGMHCGPALGPKSPTAAGQGGPDLPVLESGQTQCIASGAVVPEGPVVQIHMGPKLPTTADASGEPRNWPEPLEVHLAWPGKGQNPQQVRVGHTPAGLGLPPGWPHPPPGTPGPAGR